MSRGPKPEHTREWVRDVVRSGRLGEAELHRTVEDVVRADHPDLPGQTAGDWIAQATRDWIADAAGWPDVTDHDRLQAAFGSVREAGIEVLQGCRDHWDAKRLLQAGDRRGVVWFTESDIWHAIDEPMLELNLWHGDSANAAPGDELLDEVLALLGSHGLSAHFDEGRIEVPVRWQARPSAAATGVEGD